MNAEIAAELACLNAKYSQIMEIWFDRRNNNHKLYSPFVNLRNALRGGIPNMHYETLDKIKGHLKKWMPDERFFPTPIELLSDSEEDGEQQQFQVPQPRSSLPTNLDISDYSSDDDNNDENIQQTQIPPKPIAKTLSSIPKRPQNPLNSIAQYRTKSLKLKPASSYAKRTENERAINTLTVPYKTPIAPKASFDPKKEATKLSLIKEKIYMEKYIKLDKSRKEEIENNCLQLAENNSASSAAQDVIKGNEKLTVVKGNEKLTVVKAKLTVVKAKRRQSCFAEVAPNVKLNMNQRRNSLCADNEKGQPEEKRQLRELPQRVKKRVHFSDDV